MEGIDQTTFTTASIDTSKALTRVMILHPVACSLTFIAFFLALGSGFCGAIFAAFVAAIAWIITIVVMATDFVSFGIIKNHVNSDGSGSHAYFSVGMWTILAAMILLFFATFIVIFTCCSSRLHRQNNTSKEGGYVNNGTNTNTTRRHFWQRERNY
jgi:glucan phosphoethanolaminetransferase (alkaline phosphatase superfamily)